MRGDWFVRASTRAPLGGVDGAMKTPDRALPGAVLEEVNAYENHHVDLARAAVELGLRDEAKLRDLISGDDRFSGRLGLAPLTEGGEVTRERWESREFGLSAYQFLGVELGLGPAIAQ